MKLTELNAYFIGSGGEGVLNADGSPAAKREGVGLICNCPCGCDRLMFIPFKNPLDGLPSDHVGPTWQRDGDTIETLSLHPSIKRNKINGEGCEWHGFITNGEAKGC